MALHQCTGKLFQKVPGVTTTKQTRNWAKGRTGKVAWMISDCTSHNNRLIYGKKLAEYISVDIYGQCGTAVPGCTKWNHWTSRCSRDLLQKYKFYLAFENTDCESYVTDKFFRNALSNDVLPIVMGARRDYYERIAPPHSFIHVNDYPNAQALATYLHKLDKNNDLYNEYFVWKGAWGYLEYGNIFCRLCALLHAPQRSTVTTYKEWQKSEKCGSRPLSVP